MWRLGWCFVTPDETAIEPQEGLGDFVHKSPGEAFSFANEHYRGILGIPPLRFWCESEEDGTILSEAALNGVQAAVRATRGPIAQVHEFHKAFGLAIEHPIHDPDTHALCGLLELRLRLLKEEFEETEEAVQMLQVAIMSMDPHTQRIYWAALLKELSDLRYVTYGLGISFGLEMTEAFQRVHESNMSKLVNGKPLMRADGKVLKPPTYKPADLLDLIP